MEEAALSDMQLVHYNIPKRRLIYFKARLDVKRVPLPRQFNQMMPKACSKQVGFLFEICEDKYQSMRLLAELLS